MNAEAESAFADLLSPAGALDPYPLYARLRSAAPVYKSDIGMWILTRYEDCRAVLRDARMGKDWPGFMATSGIDDWREHESVKDGDKSLLFANPPEHTRLRRLVSKAFTPRQVERLRVSMRDRIDTLLDKLAADGGGDLLDDLAFPLPVSVIGQLLGVPEQDWTGFRQAVRAGTATLEIGVTHEQIAVADEAFAWMGGYFEELIREKRAHPDDAMISGMIAVEENGDRLSDDEIMRMSALLFAAGFETTTNLIGNGMHALMHNPDQLQLLRDEPARIEDGVEELLRYDASIQISGRSAFEDMEVGGHTVRAGESVLTLLGAANRDPERYGDPDRLDVTRTEIEPLSFGNGIHFCLGASLARVEAQEAIGALIGRFASIEFAEEPRFRAQLGFRGLESFPIRCH